MTRKTTISFIGRASIYSPNNVKKDLAILTDVRRHLVARGYYCHDILQEDAVQEVADADVYISMGRRQDTLNWLGQYEKQWKTVINPTASVMLCNQRRMLMEMLERQGISVAPHTGTDGYWVKRGYGSAESDSDIQYAADRETAERILQEMTQRGIKDVEIRAHVKGDLLKFYAVKGTDFFRYYYPTADGEWKFHSEKKNGAPHYYPYDEKNLKAMIEAAADWCHLQVYGGDCIICPDGRAVLIDLNDWPSFSRCREEAAKAIADHISQQIDNTPIIYRESTAYLLDYGGTLDTGGRHWGKVLWKAWEKAGVPVTEDQFREAYIYAERAMDAQSLIGPDDTFRQTLDTKLRLELEYVGHDDYRQQILDDVYEQTKQHTAHSRSVLKTMAAHFPLVLVSNFYGNLETVLKEFGMDGIFQHVIESAKFGIRKPDSRLLKKGIEALNLQPEDVTMVGDSIKNDILPALEIGCRTIWLSGEQWDDTPIGLSPAHRTIKDIEELLIDFD